MQRVQLRTPTEAPQCLSLAPDPIFTEGITGGLKCHLYFILEEIRVYGLTPLDGAEPQGLSLGRVDHVLTNY